MKYSKNYLNEVIFQIRFQPLLQLVTNEKNAVVDFQNKVIDEFPGLNLNIMTNPMLDFQIKNI